MKVLVVGGGAAGLMAAGAALRQGHEVTVLEHMEKPAQKILVTGKGRCNVTNDCTAEEFLHHVRTNPRFLFSSLGAFPPARTMELFESLGVELKVERGRRVFPVSDKAEEIRQALLRYADGADIVHDGAKKLLLEPLAQPEEAPAAPEDPRHPKKKKPGPAYRCVGVRGTSGREYKADAVLVATGGLSYPTTGSTGDGYKLAQQAGHTLVEPVPSLVSLVSHDADCKKMMGLALKNVTLTLHEDGKPIFEEQGEMLFTHFGISGPLTLSASSHLGDMKKHKYEAFIDLKPALSEEQLYDRITRDFALLANHAAQGALVKLLPSSMQPVMVARWGIDPATRANQITREQKRELVQLMKHWRVSIDARGDLAHAVITSGGVSVREVDPKTMQSKKALGLYFAGEVLDVDAYTGGYNLQIAFCTAQSFGIFRIASCGNCVFYGICNFACSGAGKIFGSSFADPVIDGHKDGDVSDSFWNLVRSDGTAVCGAFAKSKTVYGKRIGKSIQENRLCVDPTGGVPFSGVERTVLRTWNQSDRAGIFRGRTVYV